MGILLCQVMSREVSMCNTDAVPDLVAFLDHCTKHHTVPPCPELFQAAESVGVIAGPFNCRSQLYPNSCAMRADSYSSPPQPCVGYAVIDNGRVDGRLISASSPHNLLWTVVDWLLTPMVLTD